MRLRGGVWLEEPADRLGEVVVVRRKSDADALTVTGGETVFEEGGRGRSMGIDVP